MFCAVFTIGFMQMKEVESGNNCIVYCMLCRIKVIKSPHFSNKMLQKGKSKKIPSDGLISTLWAKSGGQV